MTRHFSNSLDFASIHNQSLVAYFAASIGHKAFILTPSYPFMFVGEILSIVENSVELMVETTQFPQLENRTWLINIHNIEVFYIEFPGDPCIPQLNDMV